MIQIFNNKSIPELEKISVKTNNATCHLCKIFTIMTITTLGIASLIHFHPNVIDNGITHNTFFGFLTISTICAISMIICGYIGIYINNIVYWKSIPYIDHKNGR